MKVIKKKTDFCPSPLFWAAWNRRGLLAGYMSWNFLVTGIFMCFMFGPLGRSWCFMKHHYLNRLAVAIGNFINLPYMLSKRHQESVAYRLQAPNWSLSSLIEKVLQIGPGTVIFLPILLAINTKKSTLPANGLRFQNVIYILRLEYFTFFLAQQYTYLLLHGGTMICRTIQMHLAN